ncbi:MAG: RES family NAD+ phosphorylase [Bosea sp.]|nr:RES family NAD+ phosphorylase [Bosea sp. (in: a-proteobacteria)]
MIWRVSRAPYADLSGNGARIYGGRWNSPGAPMVYAARDAALAVLEVRVHLDLPPELLPGDFVLTQIDCGTLASDRIDTLPANPRAIGDSWLASSATALMEVPSFIVPESSNVLFNPAHVDAMTVRIVSIRPFVFDERLWLGLQD